MLEVNFCVKSETHAIYLLLSYRGHFRAAVGILVKKIAQSLLINWDLNSSLISQNSSAGGSRTYFLT